jgi:hypothetical protein
LSEITRKSRKRLYLGAVAVLCILVGSIGVALENQGLIFGSLGITSSPGQVNETARLAISQMVKNDVSLALQVNVTDHGKLVSSHNFPNDLILNNFYDWLIAALNNAQSLSTVTASVTNTGGVSQTAQTWGLNVNGATTCNSGSNSPIGFNCAQPGQGGLIEVGTSSTAAARTDYNIGTAFQSYFDTSSVCSASTTDSVVISGSENANAGATITESGLFYQWTRGTTTTTEMFAHDVFSGIVVSMGNTVTIQYTWALNNAGFNYNLCELLAGYWTQPNSQGNTVKTPVPQMVFYDTAGRNVTWTPICNTQSSQSYWGIVQPLASSSPTTSGCAGWGAGATVNTMQIAIGTGTSAFTPTSRALTAYYAENYITSTTYDSAGNAYETTSISLATGATISEAAIYLTLPAGCINYSPNHGSGAGSCGSYGSDTIMLLAATFTGQVVPNTGAIGVTFQESG